MKIKIQKVITPAIEAVTETTEIEISFPFYSKLIESGQEYYFKVIDNNSAIEVCVLRDLWSTIRQGRFKYTLPTYGDTAIEKGIPCSAEEFITAHNTAKALIETPISEPNDGEDESHGGDYEREQMQQEQVGNDARAMADAAQQYGEM